MTTLKVPRFNLNRPDPDAAADPAPRPAASAASPASTSKDSDMSFDTFDDGFGDQVFPGSAAAERAAAAGATAPQPGPADAAEDDANVSPEVAAELAAIRAEGLTGRQLRVARRLAQRRNIAATSDYDAVRLLRAAGIDPFQRRAMLELVGTEPATEAATGGGGGQPPASEGRALTPLPGDGVKLPQRTRPPQPPSTERVEVNHAAEILKMQQEIARRRRRKLMMLGGRLFAFVLLPTIVAFWYFSQIATPLYATKSEFVIQAADPPQASGMGGLLSGTPMAHAQDSIAVQGYLQSREALQRLEADHGFKEYFQGSNIDALTRLPPDASLEDAYKLYSKYILISYDPTEGLVRMEVMAADPKVSADWSKQLISYAEEQVDKMSLRLREDSMKGAKEQYTEAETAVIDAQQRLVALQEKFNVLSSETEVQLIATQISQLESQLTTEQLNLAQMEANANPNQARMEPVKRRIATLEEQIANLRAKMTVNGEESQSLARIQGELLVAKADVETRQLVLAQALQSMENSRIEANRQVRYLSLSVSPVPPDEPTYPRVFENTLVTMLILLGIYLMISMTAAILREQVSA
ncbi:capsule biosynthesis protein [Fuscovulum blasticum DSM 2131]|uniref:Capsule biosynthesis protein n=2 Tax=Fuscovulum blasticum TaxID=1075 RepID=A0A2T4JAZ2_FUSBL|nr:capsule biosynthesis protein [Fuscovulum blasticum DSM 2131]